MAIDSTSGFISSALSRTDQGIAKASERIGSGLRINSAADDAAGAAIVNRLQTQESEFSQASRNASDGISLAQTANANLAAVTENLQRLRELAVQASNGILQDADRSALNKEAQQLQLEVSRIVGTSQFNGVPLLNNSNPVNLVLGSGLSNNVTITPRNLEQTLDDQGFNTLDFSTPEAAQSALAVVDSVQQQVDTFSSELGATVNVLASSIDQLGSANVAAAESRSRIGDADIAKETSELARQQVLQDVAITVQAQANNQRGDLTLKLLTQFLS